MHVTRAGLTPLKGAHHAELDAVRLARTGPVGDRVFCLFDVEGQRVLRTVEHPQLVRVRASWDGTTLTVRTPDGREVNAAPEPSGERVVLDYWGRGALLDLQLSPHSALLGNLLGREVILARVARPGEVVYAGPVSIVTTGALASLGEPDSARFRATFTLEAAADPEPGDRLRIGEALVRVRGAIPRCRVIDIDPASGRMDTRHLATLAERPRRPGELPFGVDADVLVPGTVRPGDPVTIQRRSGDQPVSVVPS